MAERVGHVAIIGNGIAGLSAAGAVRERDSRCRITLIGEENALTYSRPMLTKAALRGFDAARFTLFDEDWYAARRIDLKLGCRVTDIDPDARILSLSDGTSFEYDRCILAVGASCLIPPIPGREKDRVFGIRDIESIMNIRGAMASARRVVIIGGGVIGMEMAWELKRAGCSLTILELAPALMGRFLDEEFSQLLKDRLRASGIDVRTGIQIETVTGDDRVEGVRLTNGEFFAAEMVIISCGIRPNTETAARAGCTVNRGIVVNERMETDVSGIFACGDCVELPGFNPGVWTAAEAQGSVAGANAVGARVSFEPAPGGVLINGFGSYIFALGDAGRNPDCDYEILNFDSAGTKDSSFFVNDEMRTFQGREKYFFSEGRLVGGLLTGDPEAPEILKPGIEQRMRKDAFLKSRRGLG
ncbi:MAG: FAD-dependent oxidoreductase [Clostridiales Family XIII bacterium]|jgi:NAD(P)H-nitrite reductase large subunit|nr:FAD-dependent oxidoreductase [Clostridiales Family XIII bacterium]